MNIEEIKKNIRTYIQEHFCNDMDVSELKDDTPLLSGGIIDSISTMQVVAFLEKTFGFEFEAHEVDRDNLDSISIIADFVQKKING